ncbi:outer membrane protein transport protein [Sulfurimonas sp. SAG-AH-194-I05]|nr:outer membrane protein transport protein [Sulfurimonas sp. SAG-AH-194-I05]MDF1876029.1 outer membrane protein transport protein [Sulfurimonas sp. SAG-AH-194-I05]
MNKKIKLALAVALALGTTSAFATNGDLMIGQGAESRAMGGVGIGKSFGASSILANPALISSVKNKEFTGAVTFFMPDVQAKSNAFGATGTTTDSDADLSIIPEVYYASRISDNLVYGIAIAGTAGMGTDYNDAPIANVNLMRTELALLKVSVPFAYTTNNLTMAIEPVLQYGTLAISHTAPPGPAQDNDGSDIGFGYELGLSYQATSALNLGLVYKSPISMSYKDVLSRSIASFNQTANITSGDKLEQPEEIGIGISYTSGSSTIALDYKTIAWGSADGYRDFGWDDQTVLSIGYEYATAKWALRAGYNHAKSPISEQAETGNGLGSTQNFFSLSGFPGIVESHYAFGGGYAYSDSIDIDVAFIIAAENKESFTTSAFGAGSTVDVIHSQQSLTLALTYKY